MVIRFEVDAHTPSPATSQNTSESAREDNLSEGLASLSLAFQTLAPPAAPASSSTSPDNLDAIVTTRPLNSPEFQRITARDGMQRNLKQLIRLLWETQALVVEHGRRERLSLVYRSGKLEAFEQSNMMTTLSVYQIANSCGLVFDIFIATCDVFEVQVVYKS